MVELYEGLMTTRSMRRFSDETVTDDQIERILAAAVQAPSGGNIQPYQFVVVTDEERRRALGDIYRRAYDRYEPAVLKLFPPFTDPDAQRRHERNWAASRHLADTIGNVSAMVLVLMPRISMTVTDDEGDMDVGPPYASVYPAVQNIVLAARALGIGTVLTTVYRIHEDEVREVCGIPDRYEVVALLPLGHPTGKWGIAPRRPAPTITSWNEFGNRR
jgi:nitroreductase